MGASTFFDIGSGKSPSVAFTTLLIESRYENGHGGYTGSIAEKDCFIEIALPQDTIKLINTIDPLLDSKANLLTTRRYIFEYAESLIENGDSRVDDKWGPAGCITLIEPTNVSDGKWLFFGWASS